MGEKKKKIFSLSKKWYNPCPGIRTQILYIYIYIYSSTLIVLAQGFPYEVRRRIINLSLKSREENMDFCLGNNTRRETIKCDIKWTKRDFCLKGGTWGVRDWAWNQDIG